MSMRPIPLVAIPALIGCVASRDINAGAFPRDERSTYW